MTVALLLVAGLALLVVGAELLVRGAVRTAECFGVSPLLIGLTLVGFGTSTPELVTSVQAALVGSPGIAVGNIVGSNIANVLLILGVAALIMPIAVESRALRRDGAVLLGVSLLFAAVAFSFGLARGVGVVFVAALAAYVAYAYRQERTVGDGHTAAFERAEAVAAIDPALQPCCRPSRPLAAVIGHVALAIVGLAIVVVGGRVLVGAAVDLARVVGISEAVIGLTIVAIGTSMPELVTSLVAAVRRHSDVAIGNVLGSNIYNLLGIGGLTALISPTPVPEQIARTDVPFMLGITVLLVWFASTEKRLSRTEGAIFLAFYAGYVAYLIAA
ncbi:MAG TPA: calcium/sodium antiporter [Gammaproteobacteria bacterium]